MSATNRTAVDLGLLTLRLTAGGLLAGHGAQKLFGSFGGSGLEGTAGWIKSLGLRPERQWALLAGGSEFVGGMLTALGLLHPVGPLATVGPMVMAWTKVHAGKPIWVNSGGAELPLANIAVAAALTLSGAGRFSLDHILGIRAPALLVASTVAGVAVGVAVGGSQPAPEPAMDEEREELAEGLPGGAPRPDLGQGAGMSPPAAPDPAGLSRLAPDYEGMIYGEAGAGDYGGLGGGLPSAIPERAKEVGSDPPGAFPGWSANVGEANPRPAGDNRGEESDPAPRD